MQAWQCGPPTVDGVVHLPHQISVVLTRQLRHAAWRASFGDRTMARGALPVEDAAPIVDEFSAANAARFGGCHPADVRSDVGDVLWPGEMVLLGRTFHAKVPTFSGTEIDELFDQHAKVLSC